MNEAGKAKPAIVQSISEWAKNLGLEGTYNKQQGKDVPWGWWLAENLVFNTVKTAIGFDRCKIMATAAAPISKETLDYFNSISLPLMEIYGMSECTGPQTCSIPSKYATGFAGWAIPGSEMKIDQPDDQGNGEICFRGRHIMMGYLKNEQATAETIDVDGWLHSGDIGVIDKKGFLKITGRLKELIITAGGENVPPVLIENEIKNEIGEVVSNIIVIGDRRKFLSCLVSLKVFFLFFCQITIGFSQNQIALESRAIEHLSSQYIPPNTLIFSASRPLNPIRPKTATHTPMNSKQNVNKFLNPLDPLPKL